MWLGWSRFRVWGSSSSVRYVEGRPIKTHIGGSQMLFGGNFMGESENEAALVPSTMFNAWPRKRKEDDSWAISSRLMGISLYHTHLVVLKDRDIL